MAGQDMASLYSIDPFVLADAGDSIGTWVPRTNGALELNIDNSDCNLSSGLGNDTVDPCCVSGSFNGGIAVSTGSGNVYISNECQIGKARALALIARQVASCRMFCSWISGCAHAVDGTPCSRSSAALHPAAH